MKEITVTFENGGVFNGSANSFTLDNLITYYFAIDKNYRVQVNADTMAIELQEYQNTNGAWYGINVITAVSVQEVQSGGSGDITKEYLEENYYSKNETDDRYVRKAGDTMTGSLSFKFTSNGDYLQISNSTISFRTPDEKYYMQIYRNNINVYNGKVIMRDTTELNSNTLTMITKDGLYIYDNQNKWIGGLLQENSRAYTALHIFNNGRIAMHTGEPNTTERFLQINGSSFRLYNNVDNGTISFYGPMVVNDKLTVQKTLNVQGQLNAYASAIFNEDLRIGDTTNYTYISQNGMFVYTAGSLILRADKSRGIELFNSLGLIAHNDYNVSGKHSAYNWNGIITYNMDSGDEFNLFLNNNTINVYCYRFLLYGKYVVELRSTNFDTSIHGSQGYVSANNAPKALNNEFYSQNFLNALNLFLEYMQDNIKSSVPNYSRVNEIAFSSETFGGGFQAGGGSSRGGGVGRRSIG